MATETKPCARRTGRYTFGSDFDMACASCGQRLGVHAAEAPHPQEDALVGAPCEWFKASRRAS